MEGFSHTCELTQPRTHPSRYMFVQVAPTMKSEQERRKAPIWLSPLSRYLHTKSLSNVACRDCSRYPPVWLTQHEKYAPPKTHVSIWRKLGILGLLFSHIWATSYMAAWIMHIRGSECANHCKGKVMTKNEYQAATCNLKTCVKLLSYGIMSVSLYYLPESCLNYICMPSFY